jgi:hypothetical protein
MPFTDEDKNWLSGLLAQSEERNARTIETAIEASERRTSQAIAAAIVTAIEASERRTSQAIAAAIEAMETKLLTAFHSWASPVEQKLRTHREALRALDLQIEEIAGRVKKLEAYGDTRH